MEKIVSDDNEQLEAKALAVYYVAEREWGGSTYPTF